MGFKNTSKKETLAKLGRRTRWAPIWIILKKYGPGKRMHPSAVTAQRRSWRRIKLKVKPRKIRRSHFA